MSRLWHLSVFETPTKFYIVGSDVSKSRYRLLKIDRLGSQNLNIGEAEQDYSKNDVMELLATISEGNSSEFTLCRMKYCSLLGKVIACYGHSSHKFIHEQLLIFCYFLC